MLCRALIIYRTWFGCKVFIFAAFVIVVKDIRLWSELDSHSFLIYFKLHELTAKVYTRLKPYWLVGPYKNVNRNIINSKKLHSCRHTTETD